MNLSEDREPRSGRDVKPGQHRRDEPHPSTIAVIAHAWRQEFPGFTAAQVVAGLTVRAL